LLLHHLVFAPAKLTPNCNKPGAALLPSRAKLGLMRSVEFIPFSRLQSLRFARGNALMPPRDRRPSPRNDPGIAFCEPTYRQVLP
jgi:hypothetical protein